MVKITTEVDGKKYELVNGDDGCADCELGEQCKHWTDAPQWCADILCFKLGGVWKEVKDED